MGRKPLIYTPDLPYHVTNRSNNKEFFYIPLDVLWPIFTGVLQELKIRYECEVIAFVLMSNHYHLIISTPKSNLGEAMKYLHREVARLANRAAGRVNHFFGGRYKWCVLGNETYYWNTVRYVFQNPLRAGLVSQVEHYRYSSIKTLDSSLWSKEWISPDGELSKAFNLEWLNIPVDSEHDSVMKKALRRREFQVPKEGRLQRRINEKTLVFEKGTVT